MKITICGGGSLGHVCLGVLSAQPDVEVCLLTRHPERWQPHVEVKDPDGKVYVSNIRLITDDAAVVIPGSDLVLFCLPGFAIEAELRNIQPYLDSQTVVGTIVSSTGFFFFAHQILGPKAKLFGFQRVPFIARTTEYGQKANLLGYKASLAVAIEHVSDAETLRATIERLFMTPVSLLGSFYEVALTNSNPILHTARLFTMWHEWAGQPYDHCLLFYKEWTIEAAQRLIDMDREFMTLLHALPMNPEAIPTLLDYYESVDAVSLCHKLQSISAFQTIPAPMRPLPDGGWVPDFESRYFTEDFPYGLRFVYDLAREHGVATPVIDEVYAWGISKINQ